MNPPKGTQIGPKRRACSFTGVAVDLTPAITIIIPRPLVHAVAHSGMARVAATIALPFVGIERRAASGDVLRDQGRGRSVVFAWSQTHKRCSPVSREITLMMGGRSLA